ncbi:MAG: 50S ribosomal protein L15 [Thermoleophilia bacterium]|nr:50S ribosomal protein L15 [Thermoleophilia bacterium]
MAADDAIVDPEDVRLENLRPIPGAKHRRKRLGRGPGSGKGKTCGRGMKGAGSRSGPGPRPGYRGGTVPLHMQKGKLPGPNHKKSMPIGPFRTNSLPINVGALGAFFGAGDIVDAQALSTVGLVKNNGNRAWPVKLLATGEIGYALIVRVDQASPAAVAKIEAAGGRVELVGQE